MPEHIWSVLCYKGVLDQYTNQVSLLDAVEAIAVLPIGEMPRAGKNVAMPFQMNLVSLWMRSDLNTPERTRVRVVVIGPDGSEDAPAASLEGDLESKPRLRTFIRFNAIPFRGPGLYRFAVECQEGDSWRRVARVPMDLRIGGPLPEAKAPSKRRGRRVPRKR